MADLKKFIISFWNDKLKKIVNDHYNVKIDDTTDESSDDSSDDSSDEFDEIPTPRFIKQKSIIIPENINLFFKQEITKLMNNNININSVVQFNCGQSGCGCITHGTILSKFINYPQLVKILLDVGVDPNHKIRKEHILLKALIKFNECYYYDQSHLEQAYKSIELLLEYGADPTLFEESREILLDINYFLFLHHQAVMQGWTNDNTYQYLKKLIMILLLKCNKKYLTQHKIIITDFNMLFNFMKFNNHSAKLVEYLESLKKMNLCTYLKFNVSFEYNIVASKIIKTLSPDFKNKSYLIEYCEDATDLINLVREKKQY